MHRYLASSTIFAVSLFALTSCVHWHPLPIEEPGLSKKSNIFKRAKKGKSVARNNTAINYSELLHNLKVYADFYQNCANKYQKNGAYLNEGNHLGNLTAFAGGIAKSIDTTVTGTILSGLMSNTKDRYRLPEQGGNYQKAADAFSCMYDVMLVYSDHPHRPTRLSKTTMLRLNRDLKKVVSKLREAQSKITIASTSADFDAIIAKAKALKKAHDDAELAATGLTDNTDPNETPVAEIVQEIEDQKKALKDNPLAKQTEKTAAASKIRRLRKVLAGREEDIKMFEDTLVKKMAECVKMVELVAET